ncbi:hypothetical protein [Balneatrix alpica]|uniref:Uncharacterized protein n=1 Tax=Balneatrix alpica TaxID=75684 RepID=A0ABV5ZBM2_9GAMM|nr:hypothetical protein [Balneatrix alpica]
MREGGKLLYQVLVGLGLVLIMLYLLFLQQRGWFNYWQGLISEPGIASLIAIIVGMLPAWWGWKYYMRWIERFNR